MRFFAGLATLLTLGIVCDAKTTQPNSMESAEGEPVHMPCSHSTIGGNEYIYWYRQIPLQSPEYVIHGLKQNATNGMAFLDIAADRKSSTLTLPHVRLSDAAVYYCMLSTGAGYGKLTFGQGTILTVHPIIKNPEPALYRLRDAKSGNNSICLLTDFESQKNVSDGKKPEWFISDPTVLDMKSMDSKSNGALAWNYQTDSDCGEAFTSVKAFFNHSDATCDAKLVEKSFETDMNLNFQNLSVMGLRILLLKVAGFNLLMTLRLWSS